MPTFNIASPDPGVSQDTKVNMRSFSFGDGYTQDVADGINYIVSTFTLNWSNRPQATIQAIDDFLIAQAGQAFTWVNPRGVAMRIKCKEWNPDYAVSTSCSMSATMTQCFEP